MPKTTVRCAKCTEAYEEPLDLTCPACGNHPSALLLPSDTVQQVPVETPLIHCSFCGKALERLMVGPMVSICVGCARTAVVQLELMAQADAEEE